MAGFGSRRGAAGRGRRRLASKVLCLEWFDPPYCAGHWIPEMVRIAGGVDVLGREGVPSVPIQWQDVISARPEIIVLMSCGYNLEKNVSVWRSTKLPPGWDEIPAVRNLRDGCECQFFTPRAAP